MIRETSYQGVASVPSDYECPDGQTQLLVNMTPEPEGIRAMPYPTQRYRLTQGRLVLVHETASGDNHIVAVTRVDGNNRTVSLYWAAASSLEGKEAVVGEPQEDEAQLDLICSLPDLADIKACGNLLVVATSKGLYYVLWDNGSYLDLGMRPPRLETKVSIITDLYENIHDPEVIDNQSHVFDEEGCLKGLVSCYNADRDLILKDEERKTFCDKLFAVINRKVAEKSAEGKFCFPFFIRFCYKLFDGSRYMHTPPQLIVPNSAAAPVVVLRHVGDSDQAVILLPNTKLSFRMKPLPDKWKHLISGVEVAVSAPIVSYTADDTCFVKASKPTYDELARIFADTTSGAVPFAQQHVGNYSGSVSAMPSTIYNLTRFYVPPNGTMVFTKISENQKYLIYLQQGSMYVNYGESHTNIQRLEDSEVPSELELEEGAEVFSIESVPVGDEIRVSFGINDTGTSHEFYIAEEKTGAYTEEVPHLLCHFKRADNLELRDVVERAYTFYVIKTVPVADLLDDKKNSQTGLIHVDLSLGNRELSYLETLPVMEDDYRSGDTLVSPMVNIYNERAAIAPQKIVPFGGHAFLNTFSPPYNKGTSDDLEMSHAQIIRVGINEGGVAASVYTGRTSDIEPYNALSPYPYNLDFLRYYYYPNANATEVQIKALDGACYRKTLTPHPYLNGAYAFNDFLPIDLEEIDSLAPQMEEIPRKGIIRVSEVSNPLLFPATGAVQVGGGDVKAICPAARALSQGQFGQFPLYAFTTEGVWALEVGSTGAYSARQPVTRDVCRDAASILQLDSEVLFASDRGIMLLSGSQATCITEDMTPQQLCAPGSLPGFDGLLSTVRIPLEACDVIPFSDYLDGCRMIYDYIGQHVIVFNPAREYAYVRSLRTGQWGMMQSDLRYPVPSYPDALCVDSQGGVLDYSHPMEQWPTGLLLTRPLKLGEADALKTIDTLLQRGDFARGQVSTVLWGSRDLRSWFVVWTSKDHMLRGFRGTPYKYFRIGAGCSLTGAQTIAGASVSLEPRLKENLR